MSDVVDRDRFDRLLEILLRVPALTEREMRDAIVINLTSGLPLPFDPRRSDDTRADLAAIAGACAAQAGGLQALTRLLSRDHPSLATDDAASLVGELERADTRPAEQPIHRMTRTGMIWGNVPGRNQHFTGRASLLDRLVEQLKSGSKLAVLPHALQGIGGVGKTQLVTEYVYRHQDEYDLIWWIPAEQTTTVLTALRELADQLNLPVTENLQETARTVLTVLAGSDRDWLLIYDNADDPGDLEQLIPTTGGHVIVTTRNQEWGSSGPSLEVDVFERDESVEMLGRRTTERGDKKISGPDAELLADRLGDLPLALEQAAAWYLATAMPVSEYIELLDSHTRELLDEGKPADYHLSVAAFVGLALDTFRGHQDGVAQLFSLFAYLGGEPVPISLLRRGSGAQTSEPLRVVLNSRIEMGRAVRTLGRYGLAKVDPSQRVQVHRLVQRVLRDTLSDGQRAETLRNVRNVLIAANPGDPDEHGGYDRQVQIGPHIEPAAMIEADSLQGRQLVLDHARFLWLSGDYENSRYLATSAARRWAEETWHERLGPTGELTLLARAQEANALRTLGFSTEAANIMSEAWEGMRGSLGELHEFTLINANQIGLDLRIAGRYQDALDFDTGNVRNHLEVFDPAETYVLRAKANLAVDYRLTGRYTDALALDREIGEQWENAGGTEPSLVFAYLNQARSYYSMGAYSHAVALIERWLPTLRQITRPENSQRLLAGRTYAITLRKLGRLTRALEVIEENHGQVRDRFTADHEFTLAAAVSFANARREAGAPDHAAELLDEAIGRYRVNFGADHPLTLAAQVNAGINLRTLGDVEAARDLDQASFDGLAERLGPEHPFTMSAGVSLASDHAAAGDTQRARDLSALLYERSLRAFGVDPSDPGRAARHDARNGAEHPYRSVCGINLALDQGADGEDVYQESLAELTKALGPEHTEVAAAEERRRLAADIEAPPT
ncbi:FxSxx-COOH system tetratricopeptide repeat protein [Actinoplanes sp. NPDC089786]|uniref:FxSxx-COOH system tetratricopeptide repeat protein n=1 Tax=Actinoplanes sp. NPDC089786 TaxID=3155185 RepID=UPI003444FA72